MPVYEEKLLSPLSIRYLQAEIRSKFRDGREVELSIAEIEATPGVGDYDLVLRAPFPAIEIFRRRVRPKQTREGEESFEANEVKSLLGSVEENKAQWFTFDHRRLFCLQRAAVAHWPLRVAAVVEVLYADHPSQLWRKKFDTFSGGRAVRVKYAHTTMESIVWDWRTEVAKNSPPTAAEEVACKQVAADQAKTSVRDLLDQPGDDDPVTRLLAAEAEAEARSQAAEATRVAESAKARAAPTRRPHHARSHARPADRAQNIGPASVSIRNSRGAAPDVPSPPRGRRRPRARAQAALATCAGEAIFHDGSDAPCAVGIAA